MTVFTLDNVKNAMVFGAHPDDEIIGTGGVIHYLSSKGREVYVVTFTGGGTSANSKEGIQRMIETRKSEMKESDKILGITQREFLQIPSQHVYSAVYGSLMVQDLDIPSGEITLHHKLISLIRKYQPDILFTHSPDNHRDHDGIAKITSQSVFQASEYILGHLGEPWKTPILLYYSVETELQGDYVPNFIIEIRKEDLDAKISAMKTQVSQTREDDYLRRFQDMILGRAMLHGAKNYGAERYAEPFHLSDKTPIRIGLKGIE